MKRKHFLFFTCEIVFITLLALLGILSLKKEYTSLFFMSFAGIVVCSFLVGFYKGSIAKHKKVKTRVLSKTKRNASGFWLFGALLLLINQSIGIVDLLPDFISYIIIARFLSRAAYKAPGFSEARAAFLKLALVNALKLPALMIITVSRTGNTLGNDLTAVMSLSFAVVEFIFFLSAVKNLFDALFRLGERTDAASLIKPVSLFGIKIRSEAIKVITLVFAITKCVFEFFPDLFLLTGTAKDGFTIITVRIGYPISIILTQLVGTVFGIFWFVLITKYLIAVRKEGKFNSALDSVEQDFSPIGYEKHRLISKLKLGLTFIFIAALFSIELKFDSFFGINLLPHTMQAILFLIAINLIGDYISKKRKRILIILSSIYLTSSVISYVTEIIFMYEFGYRQLLPGVNNSTADLSYLLYEIASVLECIAFIVLIIALFKALREIILEHTAIPPNHERYSRADADYHKIFINRGRLMCMSGIMMAISRLVNIFIQARVESFFTTQPIITLLPIVPWFGLLVFIFAVIYTGLSLYFTSILKEDIEMKYIEH